jgi:hypothetical protein
MSDPTTTETKVFSIPESNLGALQARIEKLSKKAVKLLGEPIVLTVVGEKMVPVGEGRLRKYFEVTVTGPQPKINGYKLVGAVDVVTLEDGTKDTIIRAAPDQTVPRELGRRVEGCDHCHTTRSRKTLYVLQKVGEAQPESTPETVA